MRDSYQKLLALSRDVVRQASEVMQRWRNKRLKVVGKWLRVEAQIGQLRHFLPLIEKVITQTKQRVLGGNCHVEKKVLSLFEAHTEVIRKGKAHKPNEFGRLVRIDEVENGIVSGYEVLEGNTADTDSFLPALEHQKERWFKRALHWRAGEEATISHLKNPFSMWRAFYKGERGFQRYVGWSVISKNLFSLARWQERKKRAQEERACCKWLELPPDGGSC